MWGASLGGVVSNIRNNRAYIEHRAELEAMGFDYSPQPTGYGWDVVKEALLVYRDTNGHLRVPHKFIVPDAEPWPEEMWGASLGSVVSSIRNNGAYIEHRAELEAMGFDYSSQPTGYGWDVVKEALSVYRDTNGHLRVPRRFIVPDAEPWPEEMWGASLGSVVSNIRNRGYYKEHRSELEATSFDFEPQRKRPVTKTHSSKLLSTAF
jgi:hypothetical protein